MRPLLAIAALLLAPVLLAAPEAREQSDPAAVQMLDRAQAAMGEGVTRGTYRVEIIRPEWQRTIRFETTMDHAADRFRMELLAPRKSAGTVFDKDDGTLSMSLPKLGRRIVISPAMLQEPWMGTDFSNRDILDLDALEDHYVHRMAGEDTGPEGEPLVVIRSEARPEAPVTWHAIEHRLRRDGIPVRIEYYDSRDRLVRTLRFEDVRELGGRMRPARWVMQPADAPQQRTEVVVESLERLPESPFDSAPAPDRASSPEQ